MSKELVFMAPVQVKKELNIANIYDLTVLDFYAKAKKMLGSNVTVPFIWNVNGKPIVELARSQGIDTRAESISEFVTDLIQSAESKLKEHFLNFDFSIRDDQIEHEINSLLSTKYTKSIQQDVTNVNECSECGNIYGSDPSITQCKVCKKPTVFHQRPSIFKKVAKKELAEKMESIEFHPPALKAKLENFMNNLPNSYNLLLEKRREYTPSYQGYQLDPRFVTVMTPAVLNNLRGGPYETRTVIHGDVVKKFDYYSLAYMDKDDIPTQIIAHSLLLGPDKKKLRWRTSDGKKIDVFAGVKNKELRAFFLKHGLTTDIIVDSAKMKDQMTGLIRLYVTMNRILEQRNLGTSKTPDNADLRLLMNNFRESVNQLKLAEAFENMRQYVDKSWKIVKNQKLSPQQHKTIGDFKQLYFGA